MRDDIYFTPKLILSTIKDLKECLAKGEGDSFTETGLINYTKRWEGVFSKMSSNSIPIIIDPLGKAWNQPDSKNFLIDNESVVMTKEECNKLHTYSHSAPTGVYAGKMWKRKTNRGELILCWYGYCEIPGHCSNNERWIILV